MAVFSASNVHLTACNMSLLNSHADYSKSFPLTYQASALQIKAYDIKEGQEMVGTIDRTMLFHGAQVDIGAEYDAYVSLSTSHQHLAFFVLK